MTEPQRKLLTILKDAGDVGVTWYELRRVSHPWTRGSVLDHGWVEIGNDHQRDEVWYINDAGLAVLAHR